MAGDDVQTAFVTGAAGLIGTELVRVLVARGFHVFGLARSAASVSHVRRLGAIPIRGDMLVPGQWLDEASADWVFHIPPCVRTRPWPWRRGDRPAHTRATMDAHLLDAVAAGATRRIVYVADGHAYGPTGPRPVTEDEATVSAARGYCSGPALERLDGYVIAGLPIVTAIPGCVYGGAAWFRDRVVDPIMAGRRVLQFGKAGPWVSPIHAHDCARALLHLADHGDVGSRYFLANDEPIRLHELARTVARLANRPLRAWRLPAATARLFVGHPLADYVCGHHALSNIRLRGTGFRFHYPTLEQGVRQVLGTLHD
jgi:uncharacterized protein